MDFDIQILMIDFVKFTEFVPHDPALNGQAWTAPPMDIINAHNPEMAARPPEEIIHTIAHIQKIVLFAISLVSLPTSIFTMDL